MVVSIDIDKIRKERPIVDLLRFSIINIDKPTGPTSFDVSNYVRKSLKLTKTSHFGTLDPQVTGVLPVALDRACRLNEYFMHRDKTYVGIMRLHNHVSEENLRKEIKNFIGKIKQLPPIRSSVKRAERIREIKSFDIIEINDKDILFSTTVQAGTYIRKLIHDIGLKLGGAHMLELRRTKAGFFSEPNVSLYQFDKAILEYKKGNENLLREIITPAEIITTIMPVVQVKKFSIRQLLTGKPLMAKDILGKIPDSEKFLIFDEQKFIGVYRRSKEGDIIARAEFVLN